MTVLILGGDDDAHAAHMLRYLRSEGADALILDSRWFPTSLTLAFDPEGAGEIGLPCGRRVAFEAVRSVYWRSYYGVAAPELPDPDQDEIAANDARGLFETMLIRLPARWVNGWRAFQLHQTKPAQLAAAAALGARIPATLITNDAEAILRFAARYPRSIFKPVQGGAHARPVTPRHLTRENLSSLSVAPVTIQEEAPGTNIRVFVAGERVLACEVRTECLDFRDDERPEILVHQLPGNMAALCRGVARGLDLLWTGMDFRLTPDGRYIFLEANPSPMFLGFEAESGLPLTESLAALLR